MRKILMKDVTSGSENVKRVFRVTLNNRTAGLMYEMEFTNDELLEIIKLTKLEDIQTYRQSEFYERLVRSQPGPFLDEVFGSLLYYFMYSTKNLKALIEKAGELSEKNKGTWLRMMVQNNRHVPSEAKEYGINTHIYPYNVISAANLIMNHQIGYVFSNGMAIFSLLDTMTEDQLVETYKKAISTPANFDIFTKYSKTPTSILDMLFNDYKKFGEQTFDKIMILVELPQASEDIKGYVYDKTGDDKYMPEGIRDIFMFDA